MHTVNKSKAEIQAEKTKRWGVWLVLQSVFLLLLSTTLGKFFYATEHFPYLWPSALLFAAAFPSFHAGLLLLTDSRYLRAHQGLVILATTPSLLFSVIIGLLIAVLVPRGMRTNLGAADLSLFSYLPQATIVACLLCFVGYLGLILKKPPHSPAAPHTQEIRQYMSHNATLLIIGFLVVLASTVTSIFIPGFVTPVHLVTLAGVIMLASAMLASPRPKQ